jgi:glutamate dehydrogenase
MKSDILTIGTQSNYETAFVSRIDQMVTELVQPHSSDSTIPLTDPLIRDLSVALFRKAPNSVLFHRDLGQLAQIVRSCYKTITNFLVDSAPFATTWHNDSNGCRLVAVLPDRPFLVQTLVSLYECFHLDIGVLLHPILKASPVDPQSSAINRSSSFDPSTIDPSTIDPSTIDPSTIDPSTKGPLSVIYVECREQSPEVLKELQAAVTASFTDVVACTSDYQSMRQRVAEVAHWFQSHGTKDEVGMWEHKPLDNELQQELAGLLRWLTGSLFLHLGAASWRDVGETESDTTIQLVAGCAPLGILKQEAHTELAKNEISVTGTLAHQSYANRTTECARDIALFAQSGSPFATSRLKVWSRVQRLQRIVHLQFRTLDKDGPLYHSFLGLFTLAASGQPSTDIPFIRRKLSAVLSSEGASKGSHDFKFINRALDNMPKELALCLDDGDIREFMNVSLGVYSHGASQVAIHINRRTQRIDTLVVIPKNVYSARIKDIIGRHIELRFGCTEGSGEISIDHSADNQVRIYIHLPIEGALVSDKDLVASIEMELIAITQSWFDRLEDAAAKAFAYPLSHEILARFIGGEAFTADYQATYSPERCIIDMQSISKLDEGRSLDIAISGERHDEKNNQIIEISLYRRNSAIPINKALPLIENFGFEVHSNIIHQVTLKDGQEYFIHRYNATPSKPIAASPRFEETIHSAVFKEAILAVVRGEMESDVLNQLVLSAGLSHKAVAMLRAYSGYLWQVIKYATRGSIYHALAKSPEHSSLLWSMFEVRFSPNINRHQAEAKENEIRQGYVELLRSIKNINQDRILRGVLTLITNTKRTNFYQNRDVLAFKIHSRNLDILPNPKPLFEIYVRSIEFEGVHLRNGKTARGGIRWSERTEDYRQEILGLMKTQTIKNVLIVPTGAKGGFAVRYLPEDPTAMRAKVEQCYKEYIRALLSVTDNLVSGNVVFPDRVVVHDEADPYLVVAADKGTATFSDLANKIATNEFSFWLGDAFASGGSNGYDHKKYGITARGAFESVKRHFHDLQIDYLNAPFTAIGIGDMSGDVFGNGLLLSNKVKLIAAFNHAHVFIDPNPDCAVSFEERQRLFALPRSKWSDYNPELISKGGAVYERFDKEITLSPEARSALGLNTQAPEKMNGEELIRLVLSAPVTLLWNGGIGTYVKASSETNADVNDGTNDQVRIDANALRARIVGEGGNLGFTQLARIEFSKKGGRIITDAIDNSAGVDLSDHEVNLKLCLKPLVESGKLKQEDRNQLLLEIVDEVTESVLEHNKNHSAIVSLGLLRSLKSIHYFQSLIRELEKKAYIDRALEALPSAEELAERTSRKEGLYMPELAVCMAAVKMWITDQLVHSTLIKDPLLDGYLLSYFPRALQERFKEEILNHPLRREIIAAQVTNTLVDAIGITFLHRMCISHAVTPITVVKCALAAELLLQSKALRDRIRIYDTPQLAGQYMRIRGELNSSVRIATSWLIGWHGHDLPLDQMVEMYRPAYEELQSKATFLFTKKNTPLQMAEIQQTYGVPVDPVDANNLLLAEHISSTLDMLTITRTSRKDAETVAACYFLMIEALRLGFLLGREEEIDTLNKWEHQVMVGAFDSIRKSISRIATSFLELTTLTAADAAVQFGNAIETSRSFQSHLATIEEMQSEKPNAASLAVLARQLENFRL